MIEKELEFFKSQHVQVIWQCGKLYVAEYDKYNDLEELSLSCCLLLQRCGTIKQPFDSPQ